MTWTRPRQEGHGGHLANGRVAGVPRLPAMFLGRRRVDGKALLAYEDAREVHIVPRQGLGETISHFSNQFTDGCARRGHFLPSTAMNESRFVIANRPGAPSPTQSGFRSWSAAAVTRNPCARARPSRSVSTRPEPDAGALIVQGLSDRNPVHSGRSRSLSLWNSERVVTASLGWKAANAPLPPTT